MGNVEVYAGLAPSVLQGQFETVETLTAACEKALQLRGWEDKQAAYELGIPYCFYQRMVRPTDSRKFDADLVELTMRKAGNLYPLHWLAWRMGQAVYPLEFMQILAAIREAVTADGKVVRFTLEEGR